MALTGRKKGTHKHDKVGYCLHIRRVQTSVYDHARQPAGRHYTILAEAVVKVKCYQTALRERRAEVGSRRGPPPPINNSRLMIAIIGSDKELL